MGKEAGSLPGRRNIPGCRTGERLPSDSSSHSGCLVLTTDGYVALGASIREQKERIISSYARENGKADVSFEDRNQPVCGGIRLIPDNSDHLLLDWWQLTVADSAGNEFDVSLDRTEFNRFYLSSI